jgi:hypothetical protein
MWISANHHELRHYGAYANSYAYGNCHSNSYSYGNVHSNP